MENLLHRDRDEPSGDESRQGPDREITLGTTMILAIFFGLAVFAAVFFGFGYSMGSKRNAAVPAPSLAAVSAPTAATSVAAAKPAAGSVLDNSTHAPAGMSRAAAVSRGTAPAANAPAMSAARAEAPHAERSAGASGPVLAPALQPVVQIAAVSHQEDADLLVSTLKRRGYAVAVHNDQRDKLLHVQVGPFSTRQEADAMRQRLAADGFNAIVKDPAH